MWAGAASLVPREPTMEDPNVPFSSLGTAYPDLSISVGLLSHERVIYEELNTGEANVTLFLPTNFAYNESYYQPEDVPESPTELNRATYRYNIVPGIYDTKTLQEQNSTFLRTSSVDPKYTLVTGGALIETRNISRGFFVRSGLGEQAGMSKFDIPFAGGILHAIDQFFILPADLATTAKIQNLDTLALTIQQCADDALPSQSDLSFFVPKNAALTAYRAAQSGHDPECDTLRSYITQGPVQTSGKLRSLESVTALSVVTYNVSIGAGNAIVLGCGHRKARIFRSDILIKNGVVHVIDSFL
ncbi:MAG: hypothetical protein M1833_002553 [Piccolia ochrophora]|nr:MAG: hypothetical protein M1833_002553 [Piccolia ochrophora]